MSTIWKDYTTYEISTIGIDKTFSLPTTPLFQSNLPMVEQRNLGTEPGGLVELKSMPALDSMQRPQTTRRK